MLCFTPVRNIRGKKTEILKKLNTSGEHLQDIHKRIVPVNCGKMKMEENVCCTPGQEGSINIQKCSYNLPGRKPDLHLENISKNNRL